MKTYAPCTHEEFMHFSSLSIIFMTLINRPNNTNERKMIDKKWRVMCHQMKKRVITYRQSKKYYYVILIIMKALTTFRGINKIL